MLSLLFPCLLAASQTPPSGATHPGEAPPAGVVRVSSLAAPADVRGVWRFRAGDDDAFAAPAFPDTSWQPVRVPGGLGEQGHAALVGVFWLRAHLHVDAPNPGRRELSLRLGPVDSAYEVFIDGVLVGGNGRVDPPELEAHDRPGIWPVPLDAATDGVIVVAIRAWRDPLRQDAAPARGGITGGPNLIGHTGDIVRAELASDIDKIIAGAVVLVVALYHLQLFRRRREQTHYLWFGIFATCMGTYLLASTNASIALLGTMPHAKLMWAALILSLPAFVQFLWPFLDRPIRWWWRLNQALMIAYATIVVCWPTQWFVIKFIVWFELLLLLPLMVGTTALVVVSAARGHPEARTLFLGTMALVVAAGNNILLERTTLPLPQLAPYAMALFVFSIAVSLANRFSRVFNELDEKRRLADEVRTLNALVQSNVKDRSEELSRALTRLAVTGKVGAVAAGAILEGRYQLESALGSGGMGAVYAGRDLVTAQRVAIKIIHTSSSPASLEALHRFLREARAVVSVDHPAIVRMLHVDISRDGVFYQVQELVDGVTLEARLARGPLEAARAARTGAVLADALAAAHARGVIHRDVKPANIMLTTAAPGLKLLDFGVAKLTAVDAEHTGTGRLIGTPAYMAPEQRYLSDVAVTERVDAYALGIVLHRSVTGALPGRAPPAAAAERAAPLLPEPLRELVDACLQSDAARRPSAAQLAARLARVADELGAARELAWDAEELARPGDPDATATATANGAAGIASAAPVVAGGGDAPGAARDGKLTELLRGLLKS